MERDWEPRVKRYFQKIIGTVSWGLMWLMACATAGIYFQLGYIQGKIEIRNIIFYAAMLVSGLVLARYLYLTWKKE